MERDQALAIAAMFRTIGGFSAIEVEKFGKFGYRVYLWSVNSRAGNRSLTQMCEASEVPDMDAARRIAGDAKAKAAARDGEALIRAAAERAAN